MFPLPDLPYAYDSLEPTMSSRTLHLHHDKHHGTYVKTLNELIAKAGAHPAALEEVIRDASKAAEAKLFNNAAQAWNHGFFWNCMVPTPGKPEGDLAAAVASAFGDLAKLRDEFIEKGAAAFGSGWVWLISDKSGRLTVTTTHDAGDLVTASGVTPILVCDVWEHAYYVDYQNERKRYLTAWFDNLPHWGFAASQFAAATGEGRAWCYPAPAAAFGSKAA